MSETRRQLGSAAGVVNLFLPREVSDRIIHVHVHVFGDSPAQHSHISIDPHEGWQMSMHAGERAVPIDKASATAASYFGNHGYERGLGIRFELPNAAMDGTYAQVLTKRDGRIAHATLEPGSSLVVSDAINDAIPKGGVSVVVQKDPLKHDFTYGYDIHPPDDIVIDESKSLLGRNIFGLPRQCNRTVMSSTR